MMGLLLTHASQLVKIYSMKCFICFQALLETNSHGAGSANCCIRMNIGIEGTNIDEVRVPPAGAQIATYTNDPVISITSKTGVNNVTSISGMMLPGAWHRS